MVTEASTQVWTSTILESARALISVAPLPPSSCQDLILGLLFPNVMPFAVLAPHSFSFPRAPRTQAAVFSRLDSRLPALEGSDSPEQVTAPPDILRLARDKEFLTDQGPFFPIHVF